MVDEGAPAAQTGAQDGPYYYMYVVACADGSLYTGYARDVPHRVAQHNAGQGAKYTRSRRPVHLVACARFTTQHQALAAEYRFKRIPRARKLFLIAQAQGAQAASDWVESATRQDAFAQVLAREFPLDDGAGRACSDDTRDTGDACCGDACAGAGDAGADDVRGEADAAAAAG